MTFEQMERTMRFMLEQQARADARLHETGELLNKVGLKLDILAADAVTFDAKLEKLHDEIVAVREVAISHNQAIHQLFRLHEQTGQKFERLYQQRKDDFELSQQNFEILNEQRERDMEETRKKFELADEQRARDMEETRKKFELAEERRERDMEETRKRFKMMEKSSAEAFDLIKQVTRKIDSLTDAMTRQNRNGNQ